MMDRRAFVGGLAAAAALPFVAGCTGGGRNDATGSSEEPRGTVLGIGIMPPESIDPRELRDTAGMQVASQLFDPLTRFDFEAGEARGLAAESFEVSDDARTVTFHIAAGRTFHDGEPVTSVSFKRAWERLVGPAVSKGEGGGTGEKAAAAASPCAYHLALVEGYSDLAAGRASELTGVKCPDDLTLTVALSSPYVEWSLVAAHPALAPVPAAALEDPEGFASRPVGNGPYLLREPWASGEPIELSRFDGYAGEAGGPDAVRLVPSDDTRASYRGLEAGDLDVSGIPVDQLEEARRSLGESTDGYTMEAGHRLLEGVEPSVYHLVCNVSRPPFDSVDFRRAVSLAIDREFLCDKVFQGSRVPADGLVPGCIPGRAEAGRYASLDAGRASRLLDAEYPADEDGARDVQVTLLCSKGSVHAKTLDAVASNLEDVGISVQVEALDWPQLIERYRSGDFQAGRMSWTADYPTADQFLYPLLHSASREGDNWSGYANDKVDAALDKARLTVDASERAGLLARAAQLAGDDCALIPLAYGTHGIGGSERVSSLYIDPFRIPRLETARLEDGATE